MDIPQLEQTETTTPNKKANLVLLTGYLGSGKTTLVSYILKEQKQYKVAVIQNEFSDEMGIEAPLMQDSEGQPFDKFYELPNGCICCSAKDDLLIAIDFLIQNEKYKLDFILVETNGLADPSQTIQNFWVDDDYQYPAELRSIHTVVPTHRFEELKKNEIFIRQLLFADTILVNQTDRCKPEEIEKVEKELRLLNPIAKLKQTSFCKIDLNEIFEIDGFSVKQEKMDFIKQMDNINLETHVHPDSNIECHFIQFEKEYDFKDAEMKVGTLVWECGQDYDIHRMKGILNVKNEDNCMYALQGVEEIFEVRKSDVKWKPEEKKINKLLIVSEKITKEKLIKILTE